MALDTELFDRAKALAQRPTPDLVANALSIMEAHPDPDDDERHVSWYLVGTLQKRAGPAEFESACTLVASRNPIERELGCAILGQLGHGKPAFVEASVDILILRLSDECESVVSSALSALGHRNSPRAIVPALALNDHPSKDIRFGVVNALSRHEDRHATDALIRLTRDADYDVRNWATFGLGSMCVADYPELREALLARLADEDAEIRSEAMQGLARRSAPEVIPAINSALESDDVVSGYLSAAEAAADPTLLPALKKLRSELAADDQNYWIGCLDAAIVACDPNKTAERP